MRKLVLSSGLLSCLLLVAGCPKKKADDGDAAADAAIDAAIAAAADATAAPVLPNAKNADKVATFPAQTKLEDDGEKPTRNAVVHTAPKGGDVVANIPAGTDVTKVAEYQEDFLITFADPKNANDTLMGWIDKAAFTGAVATKTTLKDGGAGDASVDSGAHAAVDAGTTLKCGANEALVHISATGTSCKKKCKDDKDCKKPPCGVAKSTAGVAKVCVND